MSTVLAPQDALVEIRREIEETAAAGFMAPEVRSARLLEFRSDLVDLMGLIDTYVADNENEVEPTPEPVLKLRENADLRDEILRRGLATPEALDEAYLYSHETLDDLAENGWLEETAEHVQEVHEELIEFAPASFKEQLHPRGRGGKFIDKLGGLDFLQGKSGPKHDLMGGKWQDKVGLGQHGRAKAKNKQRVAKRSAEKALPTEEKKELFAKRVGELEGRVEKKVGEAREAGKLTEAEAHFNDVGKVSQRTLLLYATDAASEPTTADIYSQHDPATGNLIWDESRRELHERIINAYLKKRKLNPETGREELDFSPSAADLQPHPEGPKVLFSGGGYAAGKGSVLKVLAAKGELPPDSFTLDPDEIKALLPEFQEMIGTDPEANLHVYQEAWAIAQEVQARAQERKLNIVVDGISNTSPDEMLSRAKSFTDRGYAAQAIYVDLPTDEAIRRAQNRALTAEKDSDRRMIPEVIMRSVHRDVSATVPSLMNELGRRYEEVPLDVQVWNNNVARGEAPIPVATQAGGVPMEVHDEALWTEFRQKGHETILHVDRPAVAEAITKRASELPGTDQGGGAPPPPEKPKPKAKKPRG